MVQEKLVVPDHILVETLELVNKNLIDQEKLVVPDHTFVDASELVNTDLIDQDNEHLDELVL
jgi:hypothetical protein